MGGCDSLGLSDVSASRAGRDGATPPTDSGEVRGVELALGEPPQHARLPDARVAQQEQPEQHVVVFGHDDRQADRQTERQADAASFHSLHLAPSTSQPPCAAFEAHSDISATSGVAATQQQQSDTHRIARDQYHM